jgi:hypothetical protein
LCWSNSGFSVDNSVRLDGGDHKARQALAQYIVRAPLSLQKLSYDRPGGKVIYHASYNPWFRQDTTLWDAMDFIASLTQFIPPWGVRYIHYYGLYSSRCKARWQRLPHVARLAPAAWKESHAQQLPADPGPPKAQLVPHRACRSAWARLIAKVYEVDPLICPRCGSEMKLIALITDPPRSCQDPAPSRQDRQGTAGTRSLLPELRPCTIPRPTTGDACPQGKRSYLAAAGTPQPRLINGRPPRPKAPSRALRSRPLGTHGVRRRRVHPAGAQPTGN